MAEQPVPLPPSASGLQPLSWVTRLRRRLGATINRKIILPYLILTLAVASLGLFVVTRVVAATIEERFTSRLLEAGRVAQDGVVRQERRQLEALRQMSQTRGVAEAIQATDVNRLRELLEVQAYTANLDSVLILDGAGNLVLRLEAIRRTNLEVIDEYRFSTGGNYANSPLVAPILARFSDEQGDKFAGLVDTPNGPLLITSAPVLAPDGQELAGVILIGTTLERVLVRLKAEALADLTIYAGPDQPIASTIPDWRQAAQLEALMIDPNLYEQALATPDDTPIQIIRLFEREYRAAYAPLVIRGRVIGVVGVVLPSGFVLQAFTVGRATLIALFAVAVGLVILIGIAVSNRISQPIVDLAGVTQAIAGGDLDKRAAVTTYDEVGTLGENFNTMADRLQATMVEIEEARARLEAILESIADGVVVRDPAGRYTLDNQAAREMMTVEGDKPDYTALDQFKEPTKPDETKPRISVGSRSLSVTLAPVLAQPDHEVGSREEGKREYIGDVLVLHDVTRETIAERTKDNFLNTIGHELRTPLTSISANADVLRMGVERLPPEKLKKRAESIFEETKKLARVVNDLIDLVGLEQASYSPVTVDLGELVDQALKDWQLELEQGGLVPQVEGAKSVLVRGDPRRLRRALDSLLSNACHYSPRGGPLVIEIGVVDQRAVLRITDPGVGISDKDKPKIFERFYRGEPLDESGRLIDVRGFGTGLYIARVIVASHGGEIDLERTGIGQGSTFVIYLPLITDNETVSSADEPGAGTTVPDRAAQA